MKPINRWLFAAAAGVTALTLSACGAGAATPVPTATTAGAEPLAGGIATVGSYSEMPGFDPVKLANVGTGIERAASVFDTLLFRDEKTDEVTPKLAKGISS